MTEELKKRIAQINAGTAPAGYKKTKVGIVPEEWEIVQLGALCSITTGKLDANAMVENGQYKFFTCSHDEYQIDTYAFDGEAILIAGNGDVGYTRYYSGKFNAYQRTYVLMYFKGIIPYLKTCIDLLLPRKIQAELSGSAMPYITLNTLTSLRLPFPAIEEQKSIAEILTAQDEVIALLQRQIDLLIQQKKGFLQKMFPAKGCTVPEIRFQGFSGDWEQRKLGEVIVESYNGQTPSRANPSFWNGEINWCSSGDLNRSYVGKTTEKITEAGLIDARLRIIPKGTFVMAITGLEAAGTRGNCGILDIDTALNQSCMALITDSKILNTDFLFQWYCKVGNEYGITYTQGTKQQSYNAELIQILPISIPTIDEQKAIASFFNNFDSLITLHQRKLELEQQKKKALMQLLLTGKVRVKT